MARTERLAQLRENLVFHFSLDELRTLCFDLDADLFFGCELLRAKLIARLAPSPVPTGESQGGGRFLAVVGESGSGKSSVVRAGLVPALKRDAPLADGTLPPDGSSHWPIYVITPGAPETQGATSGNARSAMNSPSYEVTPRERD